MLIYEQFYKKMNLISDENKVTSNYFKRQTIGDKAEGTYINKNIVKNSLKQDADQTVYTLQQEDGSYIDVYGSIGIDKQMQNVQLGQIIAFVYEREVPSKNPKYSPTKIVQVYANPSIVNQEWLNKQQSTNETPSTPMTPETAFTTPVTPAMPITTTEATQTTQVDNSKVPEATGNVPFFSNGVPTATAQTMPKPPVTQTSDGTDKNTILNNIFSLAVNTLNINPQDVEGSKKTIMEKTGYAFVDANLLLIEQALRNLND